MRNGLTDHGAGHFGKRRAIMVGVRTSQVKQLTAVLANATTCKGKIISEPSEASHNPGSGRLEAPFGDFRRLREDDEQAGTNQNYSGIEDTAVDMLRPSFSQGDHLWAICHKNIALCLSLSVLPSSCTMRRSEV